jgi:hypothetical protein
LSSLWGIFINSLQLRVYPSGVSLVVIMKKRLPGKRSGYDSLTFLILLDEQMRQAEDLPFRDLLRRARNGELTIGDLDFLNSKVIPPLPDFPLYKMVSITKSNDLRHRLCHLAVIQFARYHHQLVFLFPSQHKRLPPLRNLSLEDIFSQQDDGVKIPFQGLFIYTAGMPCMVLANENSKLGLVNGCRGIATGVVIEPDGKSDESCALT